MYAAAGRGIPVVHVGPGPGRELVADNDLGWTVDYDVEQVAGAMLVALTLGARSRGCCLEDDGA